MVTNVKMWSQIPLKKVKEKYFAKHKGLNFIQRFVEIPASDFIISIEGEGYWLSGIIVANIDKRYSEIQKYLFDNDKGKLMWTDINGELLPIIKIKKEMKEIQKNLSFPKNQRCLKN